MGSPQPVGACFLRAEKACKEHGYGGGRQTSAFDSLRNQGVGLESIRCLQIRVRSWEDDASYRRLGQSI